MGNQVFVAYFVHAPDRVRDDDGLDANPVGEGVQGGAADAKVRGQAGQEHLWIETTIFPQKAAGFINCIFCLTISIPRYSKRDLRPVSPPPPPRLSKKAVKG